MGLALIFKQKSMCCILTYQTLKPYFRYFKGSPCRLMSIFIRPSSDGTYYDMVMSVSPGLRPSVTVFRIFSYMLWHIELKFCMSLSSYEHSIKFEWPQFLSIFVGVMPLFELKILEIHSFLLLALTYWAEILHMTLFCCTTDQLRVLSISVHICRSYAPSGTKNTGNIQFSAFFSYMRCYIEPKFCI